MAKIAGVPVTGAALRALVAPLIRFPVKIILLISPRKLVSSGCLMDGGGLKTSKAEVPMKAAGNANRPDIESSRQMRKLSI
ncbi:hypothetical protein E8R55_15520 [Escherichia coli]|nr:hypothetical protein E8R55_15520 [Escherichia coli]